MRSGNSWTRHLLQRATGVLSGSIYNDAPLQQTGLWGEGVINDTIVVKTHLANSTLFMFTDLQIMRQGRTPIVPTKFFPARGCIHLIRNPFDSIASWFQYLQTGTHFMSLSPQQWERISARWEDHVTREVRAWRWHTEYWFGQAEQPEFRYLRVRYEDLTGNTELWLRKMLANLQFKSTDEYRVQCALDSTSCKAMPFNCRQGSVGGDSVKFYSPIQRQYVLRELGDLMVKLGYNTNISMDSHLTYVTTETTSSGFVLQCRADSRFERSVDRVINKINTLKTFRQAAPPLLQTPPTRSWPDVLYKPPLILRWSFANWPGWGFQEPYVNGWARMHVDKHPTQCEWTNDKNLADKAAVLLFSGVPHMDQEETSWCERPYRFPMGKPAFQMWGTMDYEVIPQFPILGHERFNSVFDFTISWRLNSTIHITMNCPFPTERSELDPPPQKESGHIVAYIASRCQAWERDEYVEDLMRYIPVHSYGKCLNNAQLEGDDEKWPRQWDVKIKTLSSFKFVLTFENNNITDWVTEKMPQAIFAGAVPIYMGADNIDDYMPGDHSIIKVTDFKSPQKLADYLNYLNEHDDEYAKYFEWKKRPLKKGWLRDRADCAYWQDYKMCNMALTWQKEQRELWEKEHGQEPMQSAAERKEAEELAKLISKLDSKQDQLQPDVENEQAQHMPGQEDPHKGHRRRPQLEVPADDESQEADKRKDAQAGEQEEPAATMIQKAAATYVPPTANSADKKPRVVLKDVPKRTTKPAPKKT